LVSNDDGINARGIRVLAKRLADEAENEVYVVAPDRERSATGHGLTLHKPLRVDEIQLDGNMKRVWATTGTPSDCVKFAVCALLEEHPDVVVSGINAGPNMGGDVLYSGTVSAAMEGALLSIPSIAVSMGGRSPKHYEVAADFIACLLKVLSTSGLPPRTLLNVNVPNVPASEIQGVAITELGVRLYNDTFERREDPRGRTYYWLSGHAIEEGEAETTDVWAVKHHKISVTPVTFNMTDRSGLETLNGWSALHDLSKSWIPAAKAPAAKESR
jgi:5'-nucleotidase